MLQGILARIVARKREQVADAARRQPIASLGPRPAARRPFAVTLSAAGAGGVNIIAEIKRASPSAGPIAPHLDAARQAHCYARGGAAAISVLTDSEFFAGSPADLIAARQATTLPVLRKEFIIDPWQLFESRALGADAVLLIVRILSDMHLSELLGAAAELELDVLTEIHDHAELARATAAGARLIAINNRDLATFATDTGRSRSLAAGLAPDQVAVAASAIRGRADVLAALPHGIFNFLVGEHLVRATDPAAAVAALHGAPPPAVEAP
jgi:indole-3-glycerol phosphate synthase